VLFLAVSIRAFSSCFNSCFFCFKRLKFVFFRMSFCSMGVVNFLFLSRFSMELANQSVNARINKTITRDFPGVSLEHDVEGHQLFFSLCFAVSLYKQKVSLKYNYFGNDACTFQETIFRLKKRKPVKARTKTSSVRYRLNKQSLTNLHGRLM